MEHSFSFERAKDESHTFCNEAISTSKNVPNQSQQSEGGLYPVSGQEPHCNNKSTKMTLD